MKPLPFVALNLAIGCAAVLSQRLLLPASQTHQPAPASAPHPPAGPPPPSAADRDAAAQALFESFKGQLNLSTVPITPFIPPKADYARLAVDTLEKQKASLKGTVPDYGAEIRRLLAAKQSRNIDAFLSLWLDADRSAALAFLESDLDGLSSRLNLRSTLRAYYRDHGPGGFEDLVRSAGKSQKELATALAGEDPVHAFAMMPAFSDPAAAAAIKQAAFTSWPLDQKDQALEVMASSLGQADFLKAFNDIGRRLDIHDLSAWAQACAQAPGIPEEYRSAILSSLTLQNAFRDAPGLSFQERASGVAGTLAAHGWPDNGPAPDFPAMAARDLIRNGLYNYLKDNSEIKSLYSVGAYPATQLVDDQMSQKGIPPEYRAEVTQQTFVTLAAIDPANAMSLLNGLPAAEKQDRLMTAARSLDYTDHNLGEVVALFDAIPGTLPDNLAQSRDSILKSWVEHTLADSGPTALRDWLRTASPGSARNAVEKLIPAP